jgi:hypothetical protein
MNVQLGTLTPIVSTLRGPAKIVAKRILGPDMVDAINAIPVNDGTVDTNKAVLSLIALAVRKVTGGMRRNVAVTFTVIFGIIAIIISLITFFAGGNAVIPATIFAVIIAIIWIITGLIFGSIARKVTAIICKAIESKMKTAGQ